MNIKLTFLYFSFVKILMSEYNVGTLITIITISDMTLVNFKHYLTCDLVVLIERKHFSSVGSLHSQ